MEIPMTDIINSYRQQLSDAVHRATLQQVHLEKLKEELETKKTEINDLQMVVDMCRISHVERENLADEPDEWQEN